jgi:hypothetical protein
MRKKLIFIAPLAFLGMLVFIAIGGVIVRLLWNWLLPSLFGWREITFWQAVGLLALCRILFGGLGRHYSGRSGLRHRMRERYGRMTPEERDRYRQDMRAWWEARPSPGREQGPVKRPEESL